MALPIHFLPFIIIILSSISCYAVKDPPPNYFQEESGYDFQAYPSYINMIDDSESKDSMSLESTIFEFGKFDKVGRFPASVKKTINVDDFGAEGDGQTDDTKAFQKAWKAACSNKGTVFVVPQKKNYHLKPVRFTGPCKSDLTMEIYGTLEASDDRSVYKKYGKHWLVFYDVQNLTVEGGGTINGNGKIWWQNSCKIDKSLPCKDAPTALTFYNCNNLVVKNMKIQNAQQIHVSFQKCVNVDASNLTVIAPQKSPNTDGIHITNSQNIQITSSVIGTGDDCISIVNGSQNVKAMDITCGPGHGISIGSLGSRNSEAYVSNIVVNGAKLSNTTNGVRIKTWQGGSGKASNIIFQNIEMCNVSNPIIIDQYYCDQDGPCKEQKSAVQVKNVVYRNITGTSASVMAIKLNCSKSFPCQGIVLQDINITQAGDTTTRALCDNVKLKQIGVVSPQCHEEEEEKKACITQNEREMAQLTDVEAMNKTMSLCIQVMSATNNISRRLHSRCAELRHEREKFASLQKALQDSQTSLRDLKKENKQFEKRLAAYANILEPQLIELRRRNENLLEDYKTLTLKVERLRKKIAEPSTAEIPAPENVPGPSTAD